MIAAKQIAPPPSRVVLFRALKLGDLLCAVPTLRTLRSAWPDAEMTLVGLPWARQFALRFASYVDRFVEFPGYPGLPEREPQIDRIPGFLESMLRDRFDLAIQLHGSGRFVNELVTLFGAKETAGFYRPGDYRPSHGNFLPWPQRGLEVHRLLALPRQLGLPIGSTALEFPLEEVDFAELEAVVETRGLTPGQFAVLHPGASVPQRRWPAQYFAQVADELADWGLAIVITGDASESELAATVAQCMRHSALNLAGRTSLGGLAAAVSAAALVVCNDTGVSHVADALRTPSVVISTGRNPERWAPANRRLHRVLSRPDLVRIEEVCAAARILRKQIGRRQHRRRMSAVSPESSLLKELPCDRFAS